MGGFFTERGSFYTETRVSRRAKGGRAFFLRGRGRGASSSSNSVKIYMDEKRTSTQVRPSKYHKPPQAFV